MLLHHKILTHFNPVFHTIRNIGIKYGVISPHQLRVLIMHDIPESEEHAFELQLRWLMRYWNVITPSEFEDMISGNKEILGKNLLITFDDGLMSNRIVAEKVLKSLGIKAIFFVVTDFVGIKNRDQAHQFIAEHIIQRAKQEDIPAGWYNMQLEDLKALLEQGHTIGSHTRRHTRLSDCKTVAELDHEIVTSADYLADKLGVKIEHFAFPFGDIDSWSRDALTVARKHYKYIHSGIRGDNATSLSPLAICRDSAGIQSTQYQYTLFGNNLLSAFLGGFADFRYKKAREIMHSWL